MEDRCDDTHNVTIVAETFGDRPHTATVSSLKSENSTEQLICKTPQNKVKKPKEHKVERQSAKSLVVSIESVKEQKDAGRRWVAVLGLAQVVLGSLLVFAGAAGVWRGASLSRVGAGLWAGALAVVTGVVGVLAGLDQCYRDDQRLQGSRRSPLLTGFLALSLACLACGNCAAVLAATGLHRDYVRSQPQIVPENFEDEMEAWAPVLTNIALLIIATAHCLVSLVTVYHLSKRVCSCFRPKQHFDHNQFDPNAKPPLLPDHVLSLGDNKPQKVETNKDLSKDLEKKLPNDKKGKAEFGSANSKEKLVNSWLGRHQTVLQAQGVMDKGGKIRKLKVAPQPVMLVPAHPASTLGRSMLAPPMLLPPRYATLPLPPAHYAPHIYYPPRPDPRIRRRRSPREVRVRRGREGAARDSPLTRSLERIHRKRRAERRAERERVAENQLRQTYTGLDRAYADQYIAVCDESRPPGHESLTSSVSSSELTTPQQYWSRT